MEFVQFVRSMVVQMWNALSAPTIPPAAVSAGPVISAAPVPPAAVRCSVGGCNGTAVPGSADASPTKGLCICCMEATRLPLVRAFNLTANGPGYWTPKGKADAVNMIWGHLVADRRQYRWN